MAGARIPFWYLVQFLNAEVLSTEHSSVGPLALHAMNPGTLLGHTLPSFSKTKGDQIHEETYIA